MKRLLRHSPVVPSLALTALLAVGFAYAATPPKAQPSPPRVIHVRPATPVETLTHQLEQAYEMDRITAGLLSPSAPG